MAQLFERAATLLTPVPRTTPDEWAARNIVYPSSHGRPGPRDPHLTAYLVPFERSFDPVSQVEMFGRTYDSLVMVTSSQSGKTDGVLDVIGQRLEQRPVPMLYVGPSKEWFDQSQFELRLTRMLATAPRLKERVATGKRTKKWRKMVGGVPVGLAWAGSPSQLRGMSAGIAFLDELDAFGPAALQEGDPFSLLEARGASYRDRIRAAISTPLKGTVDIAIDEASGLELWQQMPPEDIESPIWRLWQGGTRHHFTWQCPHCSEWFVPRFKCLRWPEGATAAEAKRKAYIECPRNGCVIEESHKREMNARGRYVAPGQSIDTDGTVRGDPPDSTTLSMWASGLCSPMVTFGERAASYIAAHVSGDQKQLQAIINTGFGELFSPGAGDVPEWEEVKALARPYYSKGELPDGVRLLTLTVDVQKTCLVYTIRGWGAGASSWLVDWGTLLYPPHEQEAWDKLADLLHRPIGDMLIRRCFIDSGYNPGKAFNLPVNRIYQFARRFPRLVYPTKGLRTADKPLRISKIEVNTKGEQRRYGLDLVLLDTDHFKSWVHERIRWQQDAEPGTPDRPGAWLLPQDIDDDYCKQIVSEARVKKPNGQAEWVRRSRNNHYFDCESMQAAVGHMLSVHLIRADAHGSASASPKPSPADASEGPAPRVAPAALKKRPSAPILVPPKTTTQKPAPAGAPKPVAADPAKDRRARILELARRAAARR